MFEKREGISWQKMADETKGEGIGRGRKMSRTEKKMVRFAARSVRRGEARSRQTGGRRMDVPINKLSKKKKQLNKKKQEHPWHREEYIEKRGDGNSWKEFNYLEKNQLTNKKNQLPPSTNAKRLKKRKGCKCKLCRSEHHGAEEGTLSRSEKGVLPAPQISAWQKETQEIRRAAQRSADM